MSHAGTVTIHPVQKLTRCALFIALTAICAQLIIPVGAVPVSLSLLPVLLCAAILPLQEAAMTMTGYLLLGLLGAPVFSGFQGGVGKLLAATGGYIIGYLPCAVTISLILRFVGRSWFVKALAMTLGTAVCYLFGTVWFMVLRGVDLQTCLSICVWPFIPFDALKIALAVFLSSRLEKPLARYLSR